MAENGQTYTNGQATIWRWREAYQHDFAARMDWCVADSFEKANHNPIAVVDGDKTKSVLHRNVKPGQRVALSAKGSTDPDGDKIRYRWFHYAEAGGQKSEDRISIENADRSEASFVVPKAKPGQTFHMILEIRDDGDPSLYSYRRMIFTLENP